MGSYSVMRLAEGRALEEGECVRAHVLYCAEEARMAAVRPLNLKAQFEEMKANLASRMAVVKAIEMKDKYWIAGDFCLAFDADSWHRAVVIGADAGAARVVWLMDEARRCKPAKVHQPPSSCDAELRKSAAFVCIVRGLDVVAVATATRSAASAAELLVHVTCASIGSASTELTASEHVPQRERVHLQLAVDAAAGVSSDVEKPGDRARLLGNLVQAVLSEVKSATDFTLTVSIAQNHRQLRCRLYDIIVLDERKTVSFLRRLTDAATSDWHLQRAYFVQTGEDGVWEVALFCSNCSCSTQQLRAVSMLLKTDRAIDYGALSAAPLRDGDAQVVGTRHRQLPIISSLRARDGLARQPPPPAVDALTRCEVLRVDGADALWVLFERARRDHIAQLLDFVYRGRLVSNRLSWQAGGCDRSLMQRGFACVAQVAVTSDGAKAGSRAGRASHAAALQTWCRCVVERLLEPPRSAVQVLAVDYGVVDIVTVAFHMLDSPFLVDVPPLAYRCASPSAVTQHLVGARRRLVLASPVDELGPYRALILPGDKAFSSGQCQELSSRVPFQSTLDAVHPSAPFYQLPASFANIDEQGILHVLRPNGKQMLYDLSASMEKFYEKHDMVSAEGALVALPWNGLWRRGRCQPTHDQNKTSVVLMDTGESVCAPTAHLRPLADEFLAPSTLSIRCRLEGVRHNDHIAAKFNDALPLNDEGVSLVVCVDAVDTATGVHSCFVSLHVGDDRRYNLNRSLADGHYVDLPSEPGLRVPAEQALFPNAEIFDLPVGCLVEVGAVESAMQLFVRRADGDWPAKLITIRNLIRRAFCPTPPPPLRADLLTVGCAHIAYSAYHGDYYRAEIIEMKEGDVFVHYVDYGDWELLPHGEGKVFACPAELLQLPKLALMCAEYVPAADDAFEFPEAFTSAYGVLVNASARRLVRALFATLPVGGQYAVSLTVDGVPTAEVLGEALAGVRAAVDVSAAESCGVWADVPPLPDGTSQAALSHLHDPSAFYVAPTAPNEDGFLEGAMGVPLVRVDEQDLVEGAAYLALPSTNFRFERAVLLVSDTQRRRYQFYFIDIGCVEWVPLHQILEPPPHLFRVAPRASRCRLRGFGNAPSRATAQRGLFAARKYEAAVKDAADRSMRLFENSLDVQVVHDDGDVEDDGAAAVVTVKHEGFDVAVKLHLES